MELIGTIVLLVALLATALMLYYFKRKPRQGKGKTQGRAGKTDRVVGVVRTFARQNKFRLLAPASIVCRGDAAGLDAVLVGYFGILGIIALGYNGEVYGTADGGKWVQVAPGGARAEFGSPVAEAAAAVRVLRNVLTENGCKRVPIEVVYVFGDDTAQLAVPRSLGVMRVKDLKELLKKERFLADCGLDMDAVEEALRRACRAE